MTIGIWVLGDQLSHQQAALINYEKHRQQTPIILIESSDYVRQRRYHYQKIVLVWSAMRHFANELGSAGWPVTYKISDDFITSLREWIKDNAISELKVMTPSDRPFLSLIQTFELDCSITFVHNNQFLWTHEDFDQWANSRKSLLMEDFYRKGRKIFNILMDGNQPIGGQWNFDKQNRRPPKDKLLIPKALWFEPDEITQAVIEQIRLKNIEGYGRIEPFRWGVTRAQALEVLEHFLSIVFSQFGPYQDAMVTQEETMWHALISPYLNLGLLHPLEVIQAAEKAYLEQKIQLNSVEGFVRQILGWREYMHGIYHFQNEDYAKHNWLEHQETLPSFYWNSSLTEMNCLHQVLHQVEKTGYAHHIQRLMVLSNFALIIGVLPQAIESWFHSVFIDAYDWVMQTNVIGMGQFADGGILASKPYAASANYINKMSDYCKNCVYNHKKSIGDDACPFNYFYWDFLARHQQKLRSLGRMNLILGNLKRMEPSKLSQMRSQAQLWKKQFIT